jgi:hypothetical protein
MIARLRALFSQPSSAAAWEGVCKELNAVPEGPDLEVLLDEVETLAASWPDALRIPPPDWVRAIAQQGWEREYILARREKREPPLPKGDPRLRVVRALDGDWGSGTGPLVRHPFMAHVTTLQVGWDLTAFPSVDWLLDSPHATSIRDLDLGGTGIGDDEVAELAGWARAPQLRRLVLSGNGIGDDGAMALAASERLGALEELDLSGNDEIGPEAREALRASPGLTAVRTLRF